MSKLLKKPEQRQICKMAWCCNNPHHNHTTQHVAQNCIDKDSKSYCKDDYVRRSKARKLEAFRLRHECNMTYKDIGVVVGRLEYPDTPVSSNSAKGLVDYARRILYLDPKFYGHEYCKYLTPEERSVSSERHADYIKGKEEMDRIMDEPIYYQRIELFDLTTRTQNCFSAEGIKTIKDLISKNQRELLKIPNFGSRSLRETIDLMTSMGISISK